MGMPSRDLSSSEVHYHYLCGRCGRELEIESWYVAGENIWCRCGGVLVFSGWSCPADLGEWEEREFEEGYDPKESRIWGVISRYLTRCVI
jgi:DNA-directed RNA polymerase subunit RPC12/RpoP